MTTQAAKVQSTAKAEVGYKEGFSGGHWNNKEKYADQVPGMAWVSAGGWPWCALFVSWVALKAGVADLYPRSASCAYGVSWFKGKGRWSEYPAIGSQVFFGSGGGVHTGLVVAFDATTITTVEGNTSITGSAEGDGVYLRKRNRKDAYVYGYGLPTFKEGITTADPSKKGKAGFHYKATATAPAGAVAPTVPKFPGVSYFKAGANNAYVTQLGKQLVKKGYGRFYSVGPGPRWGDADRNAVRAFQKAQKWTGSDADGYPGPTTWKRLFS